MTRHILLDKYPWREVFRSCAATGEPAFRALFEAAVNGLDLRADAGVILEPWLGELSRLPESAASWVLGTAGARIASLEDDPLGRELAPAICVFYAALGRGDVVAAWLDRAASWGAPMWRDRIDLELLRWRLETGDTEGAREHLRRIESAAIRDRALEEMARALAAQAPEEAGAALAAMSDGIRQAALAVELARVPKFTGLLKNAYRLLLALEQEPEALTELLGTLAEHHPDSPLVVEMVRQLAPGDTGGALLDAVDELLQEAAIVDLIGRTRVRRIAEKLHTDRRSLECVPRLGLVGALRDAGLLDEEDVPEALVVLGVEAPRGVQGGP